MSQEVENSHVKYYKLLNIARLDSFRIISNVIPRDNGLNNKCYSVVLLDSRVSMEDEYSLPEAGFYVYEGYNDARCVTTMDPEQSINVVKLMLYDSFVNKIRCGLNGSTDLVIMEYKDIVQYITIGMSDSNNLVGSMVQELIDNMDDHREDCGDYSDEELAIYYTLKSQLMSPRDHSIMQALAEVTDIDRLDILGFNGHIICRDDLSILPDFTRKDNTASYKTTRENIEAVRRYNMNKAFNVFMH